MHIIYRLYNNYVLKISFVVNQTPRTRQFGFSINQYAICVSVNSVSNYLTERDVNNYLDPKHTRRKSNIQLFEYKLTITGIESIVVNRVFLFSKIRYVSKRVHTSTCFRPDVDVREEYNTWRSSYDFRVGFTLRLNS